MNPTDPTQTSNNPANQTSTPGFFSAGSDIPPLPTTPTPATETSPLAQPEVPSPSAPPPIAPVPPALVSAPPTVPPPPVISRGRRLPVKFIAIIMVVLILVVGAVFLLKGVLPGVGGQANITWWGLWEDDALVAPLIAEYQQSNPGVTIKYVKQSKEEYRERLTNALARADGPDIFRYHNTWVPMFRNRLAPLPSSVMTAQEYAQTFYPVAVSNLTDSNGIVGIPLMYDGLGLFINDEIFATYGKNTPITWYEVRDTAIDLTIKDEEGVIKQAGVALGRSENVDHWQEILALMMLQNGVNLTTPTGDLAEQALKFYTAFSTVHEVWDETLPSSTLAFASGKLAMYIGPSWRAHEIREQNPTLKFHVAAVPQLPKIQEDDPDISYASYWVEGVNSQSKSKDAAWKFLKFLSTKESLTKMYTDATAVRAFGELYPRRDMQSMLLNDPLVSGIIQLAPNAKSWYLASRTFDGQTGINSQLSKYFEDAINTTVSRAGSSSVGPALTTAAQGVNQVLVQYGLVAPPPPEK